jgi:hypothetical protein
VFEIRIFTHSHWLYLDLAEMKKHTRIFATKDSLSSGAPDGRGMTFARDRKAKHTAMIEVRREVFMLKDCGQ